MVEREHDRNRKLDGLIGRLPQQIAPPESLWATIEAELDDPRLEALLRELPKEIEPPEYLWRRIESRLTRPQQRRMFAAAAIALATVSALVIGIALQNDAVDPRTVDVPGPSVALDPTLGDAVLWWLPRLGPGADDVARTIQVNLDLLRDERRAIEEAITENPYDMSLRNVWAHAYETELRLEDEAGRLVMNYERGYGI